MMQNHTDIPSLNHNPQQEKICVLLPVFNNEGSIGTVVASILQFTNSLIVINDGSTDQTAAIVQNYPLLSLLSFSQNKGKGAALKAGFDEALRLGFDYAITMDGDGQHYAKDLPVFFELVKKDANTLFIGSRNLNNENVPGKSSFGNRFSNFWFWVETGIRLSDTQSGYRLYPLKPIQGMQFYSSKYEFEIEVLVRLSWKGVPVKNIPIDVYYPPPSKRVTHFRPFRDFFRISVLNTFLTLYALFWAHPKSFILSVFSKKWRKKIWNKYVVASHESNIRKASSIGFGIFMGIFPVWGFQLAIGIPLALFFRMNKALFILAANISFFPMTPVIWALSLYTGKIVLGYHDWHFKLSNWNLDYFKETGLAFFLGGVVLASIAGLCFFIFSFCILKIFRKGK